MSDKPLCVALVGPPKCGRYLTWRILDMVLRANGHDRSFMHDSGIYKEIPADVRAKPYHFPESERMTGVERHPKREVADNTRRGADLCLWWPDPDRPHRFDVDLERAASESSLISGPVWPSMLDDPRMEAITHRVFVIRDGRDQLVSWAHYVMKPEMQQRWPSMQRFDSASEALRGGLEYLSGLWMESAKQWKEGLEREDTLPIKYEDLMSGRAGVARKIAEFLGLALDDALVARICRETGTKRSREHSPEHVRTARSGDWREMLSPATEDVYDMMSGFMLAELGYKTETEQEEVMEECRSHSA